MPSGREEPPSTKAGAQTRAALGRGHSDQMLQKYFSQRVSDALQLIVRCLRKGTEEVGK